MLFLHSLRIRAGMSWSVDDASRFISSMASSISACEKVMSPIFGPALHPSRWSSCFSAAGFLKTDTYCSFFYYLKWFKLYIK